VTVLQVLSVESLGAHHCEASYCNTVFVKPCGIKSTLISPFAFQAHHDFYN
jgi:hypothetical protein